MLRKMLYGLFGFVLGLGVAGTFFASDSRAQYGLSSEAWSEEKILTAVPSRYGNLVAISGTSLYFQASGGDIYIVKQRTSNELDSRITVISRGQ